MSVYAIKDKDGELRDSTWDNQNTTGKFCAYTNISVSDARAKTDKHPGCSVVRLVEQPKPVEVSNVAGGWLTDLREEMTRGGSVYAYVDMLKSEHDMSIEKILRALDVGWTVVKPKRYNVKVPHTKDVWYYKASDADLLTICPADKKLRGKFTESEIEHYGLQDCEKEEVTDDGIR
ncbi:DUF1642 domain-containing protein [Lacticaseibacillus paracasei]|uniref:DUF1642 domain-containing protein n=1 Tax=Lacticaseibacillus paracasei TaxID=1597 RepID=UPI003853576A